MDGDHEVPADRGDLPRRVDGGASRRADIHVEFIYRYLQQLGSSRPVHVRGHRADRFFGYPRLSLGIELVPKMQNA